MSTSETDPGSDDDIVVVDLGKKKRKQVKKLRKGEGRLMHKVHEVVAALREDGTSKPGDTIVVVVERRAEFPMNFKW